MLEELVHVGKGYALVRMIYISPRCILSSNDYVLPVIIQLEHI